MQFPFNLNYYSKYNRTKEKKALGSLHSFYPLGSSLNEQRHLFNFGKQKERFLAHNENKNIEKENQFVNEQNQKRVSFQGKLLENEVIAAPYFQQEDSQQKQQEQPINMPNQKSSLSALRSKDDQILLKYSQQSSSIECNNINQQSQNIFRYKNSQQLLKHQQLHSLIQWKSEEFQSFQQEFTQNQSVVLDRLLVFDGYHQYSMNVEDREPKGVLEKLFQYKTQGEQYIPAIPLDQQHSLSQISKIQTRINDIQDQQHPDIVSTCNSFLHQDDFQIKEASKASVFAIEKNQNDQNQNIKDTPLQIVQSPASMLVKIIQKRTNFKSILQRNKNIIHSQQFPKKKNKELLAGFFEQN